MGTTTDAATSGLSTADAARTTNATDAGSIWSTNASTICAANATSTTDATNARAVCPDQPLPVQPMDGGQPQYQQQSVLPLQPLDNQPPSAFQPPNEHQYVSPNDTPQGPSQPQPPPPAEDPPSGGNDLSDLEARFAALKNGV